MAIEVRRTGTLGTRLQLRATGSDIGKTYLLVHRFAFDAAGARFTSHEPTFHQYTATNAWADTPVPQDSSEYRAVKVLHGGLASVRRSDFDSASGFDAIVTQTGSYTLSGNHASVQLPGLTNLRIVCDTLKVDTTNPFFPTVQSFNRLTPSLADRGKLIRVVYIPGTSSAPAGIRGEGRYAFLPTSGSLNLTQVNSGGTHVWFQFDTSVGLTFDRGRASTRDFDVSVARGGSGSLTKAGAAPPRPTERGQFGWAVPKINNPATGRPRISNPRVGNTVSVNLSGIRDTDGTFNLQFNLPQANVRYQWQRNRTNIAGATTATYTVDPRDAGQRIRVAVWFTDDKGNPEGPLYSFDEPVDRPTGNERGQFGWQVVRFGSIPRAQFSWSTGRKEAPPRVDLPRAQFSWSVFRKPSPARAQFGWGVRRPSLNDVDFTIVRETPTRVRITWDPNDRFFQQNARHTTLNAVFTVSGSTLVPVTQTLGSVTVAENSGEMVFNYAFPSLHSWQRLVFVNLTLSGVGVRGVQTRRSFLVEDWPRGQFGWHVDNTPPHRGQFGWLVEKQNFERAQFGWQVQGIGFPQAEWKIESLSPTQARMTWDAETFETYFPRYTVLGYNIHLFNGLGGGDDDIFTGNVALSAGVLNFPRRRPGSAVRVRLSTSPTHGLGETFTYEFNTTLDDFERAQFGWHVSAKDPNIERAQFSWAVPRINPPRGQFSWSIRAIHFDAVPFTFFRSHTNRVVVSWSKDDIFFQQNPTLDRMRFGNRAIGLDATLVAVDDEQVELGLWPPTSSVQPIVTNEFLVELISARTDSVVETRTLLYTAGPFGRAQFGWSLDHLTDERARFSWSVPDSNLIQRALFGWSVDTSTVGALPKPQPEIISGSIIDTAASARWNGIVGATSYAWRLTRTSDNMRVSSGVTTLTEVFLSRLSPDTTYIFEVQALPA